MMNFRGPWGKASELSLLLSLLARPAIGIPNRNLSDPSVRIDDIEEWQKELLADPKNRLAMLAFEKSSPDDILQSNAIVASDIHIFNTKINVEGQPPTDQENTERCWLFAAMNIFRIGLTRKYNLPELKLSQAYLSFWDKLEKSNHFYDSVIKVTKSTSDQISKLESSFKTKIIIDNSFNIKVDNDFPILPGVLRLLKDRLPKLEAYLRNLEARLPELFKSSYEGDDGTWDMAAALFEKYGIVPSDLYPESKNSANSEPVNDLIRAKLYQDGLRLFRLGLHKASAEALAEQKAKMLQDVHMMLTLLFGPPPSPVRNFTWEYTNSSGNIQSITITPKSFGAQLANFSSTDGWNMNDLITLRNSALHGEYYRLYSYSSSYATSSQLPPTFVNVPMSEIKDAAISMIKRGIPVYFACEWGSYTSSADRVGVLDLRLYDYELGFNVPLNMSKADRLRTGFTKGNHALVLTGVHLEHGKPVRWRVENSYGAEVGEKGYFVMTDEWMDEYGYGVVVGSSFVSAKVRNVLMRESERINH